jgi:hypothetical protein
MADPVVHISNAIPDSGTGNITTLGQTLLDGANVTQGAIADAAVAAGASGSISAKLRAITRDVGASYSYTNIATATTTIVKSAAGVLHSIVINQVGTVSSTTTVYDNTAGSGTKIATIDSLSRIGTILYDVAFATGLTVVTTGTAAPDVTVVWR